MRLLTKNTDYAVRALLYLAGNKGRVVSSREISQAEGIPLPYLRRILQRLRSGKLISAKEGVGGGVSLSSPPETITLGRVLQLFQGKVSLLECLFRKRLCPNRSTCILRQSLQEIEQEVVACIGKINIGSLLNERK